LLDDCGGGWWRGMSVGARGWDWYALIRLLWHANHNWRSSDDRIREKIEWLNRWTVCVDSTICGGTKSLIGGLLRWRRAIVDCGHDGWWARPGGSCDVFMSLRFIMYREIGNTMKS
jgi:hypothetical protein